jgi:chromosome partitioning protein
MSSATIALWTAKGGTGKTVTAVNLAALLGKRGRVLLVDLDAQASASVAVGVAPANGLLDALRGEVPLAELVEPTFDWLDVVPGGPELANAERSLVSEPGAETLLRNALKGVNYSAVVVDCAPGLSTLSIGALAAATVHVAPIAPDPLSVAGLADTLKVADNVRSRLNPKLHPSRVLLNRVPRTRAARLTSEGLRERLGNRVLVAEIPERAVVVESIALRVPVVHHAPRSPVALAFEALVEEVLP